MTQRTVSVPNINCGHCVATIQREIGELDGVSTVEADAATKTVTVTFDPAKTSWEAIAGTLREIDFPPVEG